MIPQPAQRIKCFFRNGLTCEGIVQEWSPTSAQLKSIDDQSILILTNPAADIMMIKIVTETVTKFEENKKILENNFQEKLQNHNPFDDVQNKKLVELRKELLEQEKKIVIAKLRNHSPTISVGTVPYQGQHELFKKSSPQQHTTTQNPRASRQR